MKSTRRVAGRSLLSAAVMLIFAFAQPGVAYQRTPQVPVPPPDYSRQTGNNNNNIIPGRTSSMEESPAIRELEEKRGKAVNSERQRMMVKEANQLVQSAAELQVGVAQGVDGAGREEQAKRAEAIEKLARNVKDRMKGSR